MYLPSIDIRCMMWPLHRSLLRFHVDICIGLLFRKNNLLSNTARKVHITQIDTSLVYCNYNRIIYLNTIILFLSVTSDVLILIFYVIVNTKSKYSCISRKKRKSISPFFNAFRRNTRNELIRSIFLRTLCNAILFIEYKLIGNIY